MKHPLLLALAISAPRTLATSTAVEDFTFDVPYQMRGIPSTITSMEIACTVLDVRGEMVGYATRLITIPAGGDTGTRTVRLAFNAQGGKDARAGVRYVCTLGEPNGKFIAQSADPSLPSVLRVEGAIKR